MAETIKIVETAPGRVVRVYDRETVRVVVAPPAEVVRIVTAGPTGPTGEVGAIGGSVDAVASGALSALRAVSILDGVGAYTDPSDAASARRYAGVSTAAALDGAALVLRFAGPIADGSWSWAPGLPVFVGAAGVLTQTPPATGMMIRIGAALSPTEILLAPSAPIVLT